METRGRPKYSEVRDRVEMIIEEDGPIHGYGIHKTYIDMYDPVVIRTIYYHLKVLQEQGLIALHDVVGEGFVKRKRYVKL